jgi:hypothetical protein
MKGIPASTRLLVMQLGPRSITETVWAVLVRRSVDPVGVQSLKVDDYNDGFSILRLLNILVVIGICSIMGDGTFTDRIDYGCGQIRRTCASGT